MGFLDKLKDKTRGVMSSAEPDEGAPVLDEAAVRERLLAISGKGIETAEDPESGEITVAWSAKIRAAGPTAAGAEYVYRAIRLELDASDREAKGICFKTDTDVELAYAGSLTASGNWERGQHIGSETHHVIAWLGPHSTEGGADEKGYKFAWSDLRGPVMDAVTGAGWTYKPRKV